MAEVRLARVVDGVVGGLVACLLLAGCTDDEEPAPLDEGDLPGEVTASESGTGPGFPSVGRCDNLNDAQTSVASSGGVRDDYRSWRWTLDGGAEVYATVVNPGTPFSGAEAALARITEAITACVEDPQFGIVVEPLTDLPDGAVGYRTGDDAGEPTGWQVFAPVGDRRVVGVGATGLASTEAGPLLEQALEGAADLELG